MERLFDNLSVNFFIAGEFQEKFRRTKEDFGATGLFFRFETIRGIYDFAVSPAVYAQFDFNPMDAVIVGGRIQCRNANVLLVPTQFTLCDNAGLMSEAREMIEFGKVSGVVRAVRNGYARRDDDSFVYRVDLKSGGFCDTVVDQKLYEALPSEEDVPREFRIEANISLDNQSVKTDGVWRSRPCWRISSYKFHTNRQESAARRPSKEEMKA